MARSESGRVIGLLVAWGLAAADPARVLLHVDDDVVRGVLALALVDEGMVVASDASDAGYEVTVAKDGEGYVITCSGDDSRGGQVPAGPPALVELELEHKVAALVRQTPAAGKGVQRPRIALQVVDRLPESRLNERVAAALLDAGVSLAPPEDAVARLCIDASPETVSVSWGDVGDRCDGRPMGLVRANLRAQVLVAEALRLRDAAPLTTAWPRPEIVVPLEHPRTSAATNAPTPETSPPSAKTSPAPIAVATSTPTPDGPSAAPDRAPAPIDLGAAAAAAPGSARLGSVSFRAGGLGRAVALDPVLAVSAALPLWHGIGPVLSLEGSGAVTPLLIGEGLAAAGPGASFDLSERTRLSAAVLAGVWIHSWRFDASDAGVTFDPAVDVPMVLEIRLSDLVALSVGVEGGAVRRSRIHTIQGVNVWSRGALFLAISGGLTVDIPGGASPRVSSENSPPLGRGQDE